MRPAEVLPALPGPPPRPPLSLGGLTAPQHEAVTATDALLSVLAGAGAGKTRVLTLRVAYRCAQQTAHPEHVLVCTFSRKAADELRTRLWALDVGEGVTAGTIHRTALALIGQYRADHRLAPPDVMADRRALLAEVVAESGPLGGRLEPPAGTRRQAARAARQGPHPPAVGILDTEIGWAKARLIDPAGYPAAAALHGRRTPLPPERLATLFARAEELRRRRGVLDLDDLLVTCAELLSRDTPFAEAVRWRYRHLFVDEMQDVNPAQFQLLTLLLGDEPDLFVVGDPHQSVYGWNGADPSLLDRLPEILRGTRVIRLAENHRCSPQVVAVASAALGLRPATATTGPGGPEGATPVSHLPDGPVPVVTEHATDAEEAAWVAQQAWLAHRPGRRWSQLAVLARTNAQLVTVAEALRAARIPFLESAGDTAPAGDLRRALAGAAGADDEDWDPVEGAAEAADDPDTAGEPEADEDLPAPGSAAVVATDRRGRTDGVVLSTFHRAKGLQWPGVFVIGLSKGLVPHRSARTEAAMDEERRLLYVALTRAEAELWCSWARAGDPAAAGSARSGRTASPWLAAIRRTVTRLSVEPAGPDPAAVSARIAEMRARLPAPSPPLR